MVSDAVTLRVQPPRTAGAAGRARRTPDRDPLRTAGELVVGWETLDDAYIGHVDRRPLSYMAVLGDREVADGTVALRTRAGSRETLSRQAFIGRVQDRIATRSREP